jgi:hypothetical protein
MAHTARFRVGATPLNSTVRALVALESHRRLHLPDSYFYDFAAAHFLARRSERGVIDSRKWTATESAGPELLKLQFSWVMHSQLFSCRV